MMVPLHWHNKTAKKRQTHFAISLSINLYWKMGSISLFKRCGGRGVNKERKKQTLARRRRKGQHKNSQMGLATDLFCTPQPSCPWERRAANTEKETPSATANSSLDLGMSCRQHGKQEGKSPFRTFNIYVACLSLLFPSVVEKRKRQQER